MSRLSTHKWTRLSDGSYELSYELLDPPEGPIILGRTYPGAVLQDCVEVMKRSDQGPRRQPYETPEQRYARRREDLERAGLLVPTAQLSLL